MPEPWSASLRLGLSLVAPGWSPKSHSWDGLQLPIRANLLQPNKSSKETFTARPCNGASYCYTPAGAAQHRQGNKKQPDFAEYCDSDKPRRLRLCLQYLSLSRDKRPQRWAAVLLCRKELEIIADGQFNLHTTALWSKKDAFHPGNKVTSFVILKIADINLGFFISLYSHECDALKLLCLWVVDLWALVWWWERIKSIHRSAIWRSHIVDPVKWEQITE